jgi:hypothetical protein
MEITFRSKRVLNILYSIIKNRNDFLLKLYLTFPQAPRLLFSHKNKSLGEERLRKKYFFLKVSMISKGELHLFGAISTFSSFFGFLPIEWDSGNFSVSFTTRKYKLFLYYTIRVYTVAYAMFAWVRFHPSYMGMGTSLPLYYTVYHAGYLNLHFFTAMFDTVFMWYGREILYFFNQMVRFNRRTGTT